MTNDEYERLPKEEADALRGIHWAMIAKIHEKYLEGRGGFEDCSAETLSRMLREHVEKGDPVDVANFCAFLHHNKQRIV